MCKYIYIYIYIYVCIRICIDVYVHPCKQEIEMLKQAD